LASQASILKVLKTSPAGSGNHCIWRVRTQVERTIGQAASHEFTGALVRSAATSHVFMMGGEPASDPWNLQAVRLICGREPVGSAASL
jgi:hypothetical protein